MGKSTIAETLSLHARNEVIEEIERRAAGIDKKKGTYAALILEKWFADGCPPVTEADRLVQLARQPASPKTIKSAHHIDPWNLDPKASYHLVKDDVVSRLMEKLGVPNLFAPLQGRDKFETFVTFENHPTHWITVTLIKGYGNQRDDGLVFEALPKADTPRYEVERRFREHCARVGVDHKGPVKLSQLPNPRN